ncbi:hypothetical protein D3C78_1672030 [compost metagenome]
MNSQPSTGTLKMRWSMMKRIGRGLAAISSTASMKLTWLHTSTAAPSVGMCWSSLMSKRYTKRDSTQATKRSRYSGTSMKM